LVFVDESNKKLLEGNWPPVCVLGAIHLPEASFADLLELAQLGVVHGVHIVLDTNTRDLCRLITPIIRAVVRGVMAHLEVKVLHKRARGGGCSSPSSRA